MARKSRNNGHCTTWGLFMCGFMAGIVSTYFYCSTKSFDCLSLEENYLDILRAHDKYILHMSKSRLPTLEVKQPIELSKEPRSPRVNDLSAIDAFSKSESRQIELDFFSGDKEINSTSGAKGSSKPVADILAKKIRILCFVLSSPANHKTKAIHVAKTWGKRCTKLVFITSKEDPELQHHIVLENITESRANLWMKTRKALVEIYKSYLNTADWFLKADDDTYIVMENLRFMLQSYDANQPYYFGHTFSPRWLKFQYQSGGAGYVLSREALKRLVEKVLVRLPDNSTCNRPVHEKQELSEDVELGRCMASINISCSESRDAQRKQRFFPFHPSIFISHEKLNSTSYKWWWAYSKAKLQTDGLECCSNAAISFHYVTRDDMYLFEYFLYHIRPYGVR